MTMGPYEFGIGDIDCNDTVDLADFFNWNACMSGPGLPHGVDCEPFDFDSDGSADLTDYRTFQLVFTGP